MILIRAELTCFNTSYIFLQISGSLFERGQNSIGRRGSLSEEEPYIYNNLYK